MRSKIWWVLAMAGAALAQVKTGRDMGGGVAVLDSGVTLRYKTVLEPQLNSSAFHNLGGGGFGTSGNSMDHAVYDRVAQSYFGYEMTVLPGSDAETRRVTFGPVNGARLEKALKAVAGDLPLNAAPPPLFPAPQAVHNGDTIAMDLMVSSDGRERLVDYIQFSFGTTPKPVAAATATPRDFTIDDGPLNPALDQAEVSIDGQKFKGYVIIYASRGGATMWFYFPGQGRYLLSLASHEGFAKAGAVRGSVLTFSADGHDYEIRLTDPIAGTDHAWNLYVMRDAAYLPRPAVVKSVVGSVDRLESLLSKK
jgi:hypothetical protein